VTFRSLVLESNHVSLQLRVHGKWRSPGSGYGRCNLLVPAHSLIDAAKLVIQQSRQSWTIAPRDMVIVLHFA
jgi:hypothetical protein